MHYGENYINSTTFEFRFQLGEHQRDQ